MLWAEFVASRFNYKTWSRNVVLLCCAERGMCVMFCFHVHASGVGRCASETRPERFLLSAPPARREQPQNQVESFWGPVLICQTGCSRALQSFRAKMRLTCLCISRNLPYTVSCNLDASFKEVYGWDEKVPLVFSLHQFGHLLFICDLYTTCSRRPMLGTRANILCLPSALYWLPHIHTVVCCSA